MEIMGEVLVDARNACAVADATVAQAKSIFASTDDWSSVKTKAGTVVETKAVSGAFASSRILMTRTTVAIEAPAGAVFAAMTSAEGYAILDPLCDPEEFSKFLERFDSWRARLEVSNAFADFPDKAGKDKRREFVVLNAIDPDPAELMFASTSVLHASRPGGSRYQSTVPVNGPETIRALNTFALQCTPAGVGRCHVALLNWIDLALESAEFANAIEVAWFDPLLARMRAKLENGPGSGMAGGSGRSKL